MRGGALPGLLEGLREYLEMGIPGAVVTTSYPFQQRRIPSEQPVIWLGVEKMAAAGGAFSPYLGEEDGEQPAGVSVTGREVELTLRLEILHRQDGNVCHQLFGELCQRLLLEEGRPQVGELSCGGVAFDREAGAFRLVCKGTVRGVLTQGEESLPLREIQVVRREDSWETDKEV